MARATLLFLLNFTAARFVQSTPTQNQSCRVSKAPSNLKNFIRISQNAPELIAGNDNYRVEGDGLLWRTLAGDAGTNDPLREDDPW